MTPDSDAHLTVSIVTYQQASYIRQAVESVLAQETVFPFEIVIGDDASTDGTQDVLRALAAENPDRIRLILAERNHGDGGLSNFMATLDAARGRFVAFLDGDDYWTDPEKLQRQVDFLERHPDCAVCVHQVEHCFEAGDILLSPRPGRGDRVVELDALLITNFAEKVSTVVRRDAIARLPHWYRSTDVIAADWIFTVLVSRGTSIGYIDRIMAVHRLHKQSQSVTHGLHRMLSDKLDSFVHLQNHMEIRPATLWKARLFLRAKLVMLYFVPNLYLRLKRMSRLN